MIFSNGFIFRFGQTVKETGERMAHFRLFGIPVCRPFCGPVINLGNTIRNSALRERPAKWLQKRQMKKDAAFIINSLDELCARHGGDNCKSCPIVDGCKDFLILLSGMAMSIRTGDNLLLSAKRGKPA